MIEKKLKEAAVEMNAIIEYAPKSFKDKIPESFKSFLNEIASKTYKFKYDQNKKLNDQNLKKETRGLICLVYKDYICDTKNKSDYIIKIKDFYNKQEEQKRKIYNYDNIFKNNRKEEKEIINKENVIQSNLTIYKESWIRRLIKYILKK